VLEQTDMRALADRSILELSGGEQARAFLSRALAVQAPVLLADEPIAALDPAHQLEIMALLQSYARSGALVLVIMHDLSLATRYCDELVLLDKGELVAHGEASTVLSDRHLQQVYGIEVARGTKDDDVFVVPWRRLTD
jgi:iron complex transport system ATP-binding protein